MFAKVKTSVFIDAVQLEFLENVPSAFKAVLKDDKGCVCSVLETYLSLNHQKLTWRGLNDLPYGIYTMVLYLGGNEMILNMVKRV